MALFFGNKKDSDKKTKEVTDVKLSQITPNRFQPRKYFSDESIAELAETIKLHGLLQPIVLREYDKDKYEIIAGERRFRAASSLEWETVPAIIDTMDDDKSAALALIENLQRENLNPIDEAQAYENLMQLNKLNQTTLAEQVGKNQSYIANKIRLLKLSPEAQRELVKGTITQRHGRELLKLDDSTEQNAVLRMILDRKLNVAETEKLVTKVQKDGLGGVDKKKPIRKGSTPKDLKIPINTIKKTVSMIKDSGTNVKVREEDSGDRYTVTIELLKKPGK